MNKIISTESSYFSKLIFSLFLFIFAITLSGCNMSLGGPGGPDSGEEIDLSQEADDNDDDSDDEPDGPDSGDEIDTSEPTSPDSGDEIDPNEPTSPDSGDEIDPSEPTSPDSGDEIDPNEPTSPDSGDEISLNEDLKNRAKGSCNAISEGSTCVEYIGSFWTLNNAKLNCPSGFSTKACPRPGIGGCRFGAETGNEIVTWHYNYGGDPYTAELIPYASGACKALPGNQWIQ